MILAEYHTYFNTVDVHNKLALGPHSVCIVGADSLQLKIFLALVAVAESNTYRGLMYVDLKKPTSAEYSHDYIKTDLECGLLERAAASGAGMREGLGDAPRATWGSVGGVATGGSLKPRTQMPPGLQGHRLQYDAQKKPHMHELCKDDEEFVWLWEGVLWGFIGCDTLGICRRY
jgi:hypothetical protein